MKNKIGENFGPNQANQRPVRRLELLAPAGNILKMKTALAYGADAVYLGIPDFSLRVRINDFDLTSIKEALVYARTRGAKVYVTANIFAHNSHLTPFVAYLRRLRALGPDALIVSDPGILRLVKKHWPEAEIHLSTQANCTNAESARFWAEQGVSRIVLGREVTLQEIKEIHRAVPQVELEYFVHGAMCMAYSGRCFLSKMFVGRSGNLGDCAQSCRWQYDASRYFLKVPGHEEELELVEEKHGAYLLNSRDLCLIKELPELVRAGVTSFKIEGRAKSVYYQAVVCASYRRALDLSAKRLAPKARNQELAGLYHELETKLVHRGYTKGFLLGEKADQNIKDSHNKSVWEFCGQILTDKIQKKEGAFLRCKVHNTIKVGDNLEILLPGQQIIKIKLRRLFDAKTGKVIQEAHGGGGGTEVLLELPVDSLAVPTFSVLRRKTGKG